MKERISKLNEQIKEFNSWREANSVQQIPLNFGNNSKALLQRNHFVVQDKLIMSSTTLTSLEIIVNDKTYVLPIEKQT